MIRLRKLILTLTFLASIGCDPGITIRQIDAESSDGTLEIQVPITRSLIGSGIYAPENVTATNLSQLPVTITGVQLVSQNKTYQYRQVGRTKYPVSVAAGATERIPIWFDLDLGVSIVFRDRVELRVNYQLITEEGVAHAILIGE